MIMASCSPFGLQAGFWRCGHIEEVKSIFEWLPSRRFHKATEPKSCDTTAKRFSSKSMAIPTEAGELGGNFKSKVLAHSHAAVSVRFQALQMPPLSAESKTLPFLP